MAKRTKGRTNYKQYYSSNKVQSSSTGRKNQAQQTSRNGRYHGSTQGLTDADTGKVSQKGRQISRRQREYQIRKAFDNVSPMAAQAIADANGLQISANGTRTLAVSAG